MVRVGDSRGISSINNIGLSEVVDTAILRFYNGSTVETGK